MNIYSSVDHKNIDKIIILFNSCYINCSRKNDLKFFLLVDKIPDDIPYIPSYMKDLITIKEVSYDKEWKELLMSFNEYFYKRSNWCNNDMNFARFLFFITFPEVDRAVYLDWDMIVQKDIYKLEESYNNYDNLVVADCNKQLLLSNIFIREFMYSHSYISLFKKNKLQHHKVNNILKLLEIPYKDIEKLNGFNAGFYIVSKTHFDEYFMKTFIMKLINIQKKLSCFNFGTQVVMNLLCINNRTWVDKNWNCLPKLDIINKLSIIHWNGKDKPWKNNKLEENKIWWSYCLQIYPDFKPLNIKVVKNNTDDNSITKISNSNDNKRKISNNLLKILINK